MPNHPGKPEAVYVGERLDMIAEVAAFDPASIGIAPRACKYLVMVVGEAQFDTEWHASRKDALANAKHTAAALGGKVRTVN